MDNPKSSNPNITPEMIEAGRFKLADIPGMVPSQEEVRETATQMAREMFPEKFRLPVTRPLVVLTKGGVAMINPEEFDRRNEEAQRLGSPYPPLAILNPLRDVPAVCSPADDRQATNQELQQAISPMARLFAAVRVVIEDAGFRKTSDWESLDGAKFVNHDVLNDLAQAYAALNLE